MVPKVRTPLNAHTYASCILLSPGDLAGYPGLCARRRRLPRRWRTGCAEFPTPAHQPL